ncbi:hypothetical protein CEXT_188011 [Caerostris extrusa]|uniref:Uncharacterized protein n=1 Tax=Caerostris extrusa TaxID=172846 RepID=A0AAV4MNJ6_CAEEX|nr:hypothetical protein CEXT_188011 [Caerostris extrusa]
MTLYILKSSLPKLYYGCLLHYIRNEKELFQRLSLDFHIYAHWEPHTLRNNKQEDAVPLCHVIPESIRFPQRNDCSPRHHQEKSNPRPFRKLRAETLKSVSCTY